MRRVVDVMYTIKGQPVPDRFTQFKTDLFAYGATPAIAIDTAGTNGVSVTAVCTNAFRVTSASAVGVLLSGAFTTAAINITATAGRGISIGTKGKSSDGSQLGNTINADISTWTFSASDNASVLALQQTTGFAYCDFKKFNALKTIAQCRNNDYVTDLQIYYPTIVDGTDVSGNAHHLTGSLLPTNSYFSDISNYCLDKGYSLWRSLGKNNTAETLSYQDIYVPYGIDGNPITRHIHDGSTVDYYHVNDHIGSLIKHNFAESRLNIPLATWDKSDTNIFEDVVRSSRYYDAGNVDEWEISELDYLIFSQRSKINNKGLNFFKIDGNSANERNYLDELFSFTTNKDGSNLNKILKYTGDSYFMDRCLKLFCDANVLDDITLSITPTTGNNIDVYFGDGIKLNNYNDGVGDFSKHYSDTSVYPIYITKPENILLFDNQTTYNVQSSIYTPSGDIAEFNKAINIEILRLQLSCISWIGTINGLNHGLKELNSPYLYAVMGDITLFTSLEILIIAFSGGGVISNNANIKRIDLGTYTDGGGIAQSTVNIDVSNCPNIEHLNNQFDLTARLYGDMTANVGFKFLCWGYPYNALYGNITNCVLMEEWSNWGNSCCTAVITGWTKLVTMSHSNSLNAFTGNIASMPDLEIFTNLNTLSNFTRPTTVVNNTKLCHLSNPDWVFTETEVNQILADIWANRNVARTKTIRNILLGGAAPSGQGVVDKQALKIYHSPTPPGTAALWTISTTAVTLPSILNTDTLEWHDFTDVSTITKDGSARVSKVNDKSGTLNHLLQAGADNIKPTWDADGLLFDGVRQFMQASYTLQQPAFIYLVVKNITWISNGRILDGVTNNGGALFMTGATPQVAFYAGSSSSSTSDIVLNDWHIIRILSKGANSKLIVDEHTPITGNFGAGYMNGLTLGADGANSVFGNIQTRAIIIRLIDESAGDEGLIYDYLKDHYNI